MFNLTHVKYLDCSYNKLEGLIPENINGFSKLTSLDLRYNILNGTIPSWCFYLPSLRSLYLGNNQLIGNIGEFLSYSLVSIDLSGNMLQNNIPKSMFDLVNLTSLILSTNNLSGVLDFQNFSKLNHLLSLDLSKNRFSFVKNFFGWNKPFLDLSFNLLEGNLPIPLFGNEYFSISNNKFIGNISPMICNASSLVILNLSHNKLTGLIPQCLGTLPNLSVMDLQMNNLSGTMPGNISKTNMFQTLKFNHNQLEGPLPQSLSHCEQLEVLDLGDNKIVDTFPNWLEHLKELQVLVLRANQFHGAIVSLKSKHPFSKLRIFDVSSNHFSGLIPAIYIKEFKGMKGIDDGKSGLQYMVNKNYSSYNDSVFITMKGNFVELTRIFITFTTIDFSDNKFEGEIPNVIGELNSLIGLNLSHNKINGTIPPSMGGLKSLEWLDLSSNKLMGDIPEALVDLNYLSFLNLSQNQLVGVIPQGKQFNTFSSDSYEGNIGLCGFPSSKSCHNDGGEHQPSLVLHENGFEFGWKVVAMGYGCGFVFGVVMGYLVFSTGKPKCLARLVQNIRLAK